jgi:hypothetical protein
MQIDRSNYEIWIIDWLDGNLNNRQVQQLKLFLDQNHDLRDEFNDLTPVKLLSPFSSFKYKEHLKKSPLDLSQYQFEFLCAAYLENDLTISEQTELEEIVNTYPDRKKTFDQIQKTILAPGRINYKHKRLLLKRTTLQKIIRLSVTGLSTAAAIALLIITYSVIHTTTSLKPNSSAHNFVSDSTSQKPAPVIAADRIIIESKPLRAVPPAPPSASSGQAQGRYRIIEKQESTVLKAPVNTHVDLGRGIVSNTLIASNPAINITDAEDERSRTGRFISKTFRQKFLKEKTPADSRLKPYEIAEAGISGLNKLFGWQMALDIKNDENGQPKSLYFSSKMLKINAPVKKIEPQQ